MVECTKKIARLDVELTVEERNLLSVGYKNVIGARRASWRIMSSIEQKEESKGNESNVKLIKDYRQKVEDELIKICSDLSRRASDSIFQLWWSHSFSLQDVSCVSLKFLFHHFWAVSLCVHPQLACFGSVSIFFSVLFWIYSKRHLPQNIRHSY